MVHGMEDVEQRLDHVERAAFPSVPEAVTKLVGEADGTLQPADLDRRKSEPKG
jgi:hypothetical protein